MNKIQMFLWTLAFLCGGLFPQDAKRTIKPATSFSWDKKYQSYYAFKDITISDYYNYT